MDKVIQSGVIEIRVRMVSDEQTARQIAVLMTNYRDATSDGVTADGEIGYWTAKCISAANSGGLFGLFVNGGNPVGAAVVERQLDGGLLLLGISSMWDGGRHDADLLKAVKDVAAARGDALYRLRHEVRQLEDGEVAVTSSGMEAPGIKVIRKRIVEFI